MMLPGERTFSPSSWTALVTLLGAYLLLLPPAWAQSTAARPDNISPAERAFEFKALPVSLTVTRTLNGEEEVLPISRVPSLEVGDRITLEVDLSRPEFHSENAREKARLRDWSVAWFLLTKDGALLYDNETSRRTPKDRGRFDLSRGPSQAVIEVADPQQSFPVIFFLRTRTLDSWQYVRETREHKASNFVEHFGAYSDAVDSYQNLRRFLGALERENPRAETVEERLSEGFRALGFTVSTKMKLDEPETVSKLLSELDRNVLESGQTFTSEVSGKVMAQLISDSSLGLVGAAVQLGSLVFRASNYKESYHWSPTRLRGETEEQPGDYLVMSSERIRYGEREQAQDKSIRDNVRSILVCTPMAANLSSPPQLSWQLDREGNLLPGSTKEGLEVPIRGDGLLTGTQPALVERFWDPKIQVWDSLHGEKSPLRAKLTPGGQISLTGFDRVWTEIESQVEVRLTGRWGFLPLTLLSFQAIRIPKDLDLSLDRAPYLLTQGQRVRIAVNSPRTSLVRTAYFQDNLVPLEIPLEGLGSNSRPSLVLDLTSATPGPARLELYAGLSRHESLRILVKEFQVVPSAEFQVVLPEGSRQLELVADGPGLEDALAEVSEIKLSLSDTSKYRRLDSTLIFEGPPISEEELLGTEGVTAELRFRDPQKSPVPNVYVRVELRPREVRLKIFPPQLETRSEYLVVLDSSKTGVLANHEKVEFRILGAAPWRGDTSVALCLETELFPEICQTFSPLSDSGKRPLGLKRETLFGEYTPERSGRLWVDFDVALENSQLRTTWRMPTRWQTVDRPNIEGVTRRAGALYLQGPSLDLLIDRVFFSGDPTVDPEGSTLIREADGSFRVPLSKARADSFWISLSDLRGSDQRFQVVRIKQRKEK